MSNRTKRIPTRGSIAYRDPDLVTAAIQRRLATEQSHEIEPYLFAERKMVIYLVCVLGTAANVFGLEGASGHVRIKEEEGVGMVEFKEFEKFVSHIMEFLFYSLLVQLSGFIAVMYDCLPLTCVHLLLLLIQNGFVLLKLLKCESASLLTILPDWFGDALSTYAFAQVDVHFAVYWLLAVGMVLYTGLVVWYIVDLKVLGKRRATEEIFGMTRLSRRS